MALLASSDVGVRRRPLLKELCNNLGVSLWDSLVDAPISVQSLRTDPFFRSSVLLDGFIPSSWPLNNCLAPNEQRSCNLTVLYRRDANGIRATRLERIVFENVRT